MQNLVIQFILASERAHHQNECLKKKIKSQVRVDPLQLHVSSSCLSSPFSSLKCSPLFSTASLPSWTPPPPPDSPISSSLTPLFAASSLSPSSTKSHRPSPSLPSPWRRHFPMQC